MITCELSTSRVIELPVGQARGGARNARHVEPWMSGVGHRAGGEGGGIVKTCGSACHALLPASRVGDHADLRDRLG